MKATSSYKMSKYIKTGLALGNFRTVQDKNAWRRAMIQSELITGAKIPRGDKNSK